MRITPILSLGLTPALLAFAQEVFEPADFNITEALLGNGVDVSEIPGLSDLSGLSERSLLSGCSIAVSNHSAGTTYNLLTPKPSATR